MSPINAVTTDTETKRASSEKQEAAAASSASTTAASASDSDQRHAKTSSRKRKAKAAVAAPAISSTTLVALTVAATLGSLLLQQLLTPLLHASLPSAPSLPIKAAQHVATALPYTPDEPVADMAAFRAAYTCRDAYTVRVISRDPQIFLVDDFLQPGEAEYLRAMALPLMKRSMVAGTNQTHEARTSSTAFLPRDQDPVTQCIEKRASTFSGIPVEHSESLQVVWYQVGQQYKAHHDYIPRERLTGYWAEQGGQRYVTQLVYMNEPARGGGTHFPKLGIEVQPKKNMAVVWYNCNTTDTEDHRTLHAGLPVEEGQKWACNIWQRKKIPGWDNKVSPVDSLRHD